VKTIAEIANEGENAVVNKSKKNDNKRYIRYVDTIPKMNDSE